jgi:hypothetical protein
MLSWFKTEYGYIQTWNAVACLVHFAVASFVLVEVPIPDGRNARRTA